jgi:hypothetical protein
MYIVQTCMYMYIQYTRFDSYLYHVHTSTYMFVTYFLFPCMYVKGCLAYVQCTDGYTHFMKCTDIIELCMCTDVSFWLQLFYLPCWLACRQWLAVAGCQAHSSSSTPVVYLALALGLRLLTPSCHLSCSILLVARNGHATFFWNIWKY